MDSYGELKSGAARGGSDSPSLSAAMGAMVVALVVMIAAPRILIGLVAGLWALAASRQGLEQLTGGPVLGGVAAAIVMAAVWLIAVRLRRAQHHSGASAERYQDGTLLA